jgi:hypothetical protein
MWHAWERNEKCERFCCESPTEGDRSENQIVDARMKSECILEWFSGGLESTGSGHGPVVSCCECDDESSGLCHRYRLISFLLLLSCFEHAWRSGITLLYYPTRNGFAEETGQSHTDQATGWTSRDLFQLKLNFSRWLKFRFSTWAHPTFYPICTAVRPSG